MWIFPLSAALVSALFAVLVARQYLAKRRPQEAAWAASLSMFAAASAAAAIAMIGSWTPLWFRAYYLFGAIVNVPFLALGTLFLLGPRRIAIVGTVVVIAATLFATVVIFAAPLNEPALMTPGIPAGSGVLGPGALARSLSRYYSYVGSLVVAGGAIWSAWRLGRMREKALGGVVLGNLLIACGTVVVAAASGLARFGQGSYFAVGLLLGVSFMFAGFVSAGRRPGEVSGVEGSHRSYR